MKSYDDIIAYYSEIRIVVERIKKFWDDNQKLQEIFSSLSLPVLCHPSVLSLFCSYLQLSDEPKVYNKYSLSQIHNILKLNEELLPLEIDQFIELMYFNDVVLDDSTTARDYVKLIGEKIEVIKVKIKQKEW